MKAYMQRIGRSLMLPVATLPIAALFMGVGYWIDPSGMGGNNVVSAFLCTAGGMILNNLGILFAVGLGYGMSNDKDGSAALAGLVAFFAPITLLSTSSVANLLQLKEAAVNPAFAAINNGNVFIGILAGLIAAAVYNRFSGTKLPMALSFFSGRRLVPILTAVIMAGLSLLLLFIWPIVFTGLVDFGKLISNMGPFGAGLYGFFNRLLIPTGLHHALNNVFWFNTAGINDIGNFWSNSGIRGITGRYQAGFFPVMMFGLPAGAFAIYRSARPEKKAATASLMLAAAFASFFTGVSEPLEFSFMFVAWPLYLLHAALTGISLFIAALFHWTAGFNFSAGLVDYVLSLRVPMANKPYMLLVLGVIMACVYYFSFRFAIVKFHLMTPGREEATGEETPDIEVETSAGDKHAILAQKIYGYLGGSENLTAIDNCTTRLRLQVHDTDRVDQAKIKATGVPGVRVIDKQNIQIVVGTEVQFVADELKKIDQNDVEHTDTPVDATQKVIEKLSESTVVTKEQPIYSVAAGQVISITEVRDAVFSEKMLGDGFAVIPESGMIFTPIEGTITSIFPTKHAVGITTVSGLEVLLHMGIDTVALNGHPFTLYVKEGQQVAQGQLIAQVDLVALEEAGKKTEMIVVFTNQEKVAHLKISATVTVANQVIGEITSN
ncbi:N-acetylglucosamine-specific PTS transporter subunit IIBC [Enterococcus hermanniensis]|nr:N-acetylglucosamine-specific PTS transporter subunit IIBC [Enterococcus hermanniensis]